MDGDVMSEDTLIKYYKEIIDTQNETIDQLLKVIEALTMEHV
jgi:hypothetical protein